MPNCPTFCRHLFLVGFLCTSSIIVSYVHAEEPPALDPEDEMAEQGMERQDIREEMQRIRSEHEELEARHDQLRVQCMNAKGQEHDACRQEWNNLHMQRDNLHDRMHVLHEKIAVLQHEHHGPGEGQGMTMGPHEGHPLPPFNKDQPHEAKSN